MVQESVAKREHIPDQRLGILIQTLYDLIFLAGVGHKVLINNIIFNQSINVELLLENCLDKSNLVCSHESLELQSSFIFIAKGLISVLQLDFNLLSSCLFIEDFIIKEDKNDSFLMWLLGMLEHLHRQFETFDKLVCQDIDSLGVGDEDVVRLTRSLRCGIESL